MIEHLNSNGVTSDSFSASSSRNLSLRIEMRLSAPSGMNTMHAVRMMIVRTGSVVNTRQKANVVRTTNKRP